jgi:DNA-binding MarR family transcriptional regulator
MSLVGRDDDLQPLLLDPTRLAITALLGSATWLEFPFVRDAVGTSDSALSKQAALLERAGLLTTRKGYIGKRPRTWLQLTSTGRAMLSAHVEALRRIAERAAATPLRSPSEPTPSQPETLDKFAH